MLICNSITLTSTPSRNSNALKGLHLKFYKDTSTYQWQVSAVLELDSCFPQYTSEFFLIPCTSPPEEINAFTYSPNNPSLGARIICFSLCSFTGYGYFVLFCFLNPCKTTLGWYLYHATQTSPRRDWHFSSCRFREYLNILYKKNSFSWDPERPCHGQHYLPTKEAQSQSSHQKEDQGLEQERLNAVPPTQCTQGIYAWVWEMGTDLIWLAPESRLWMWILTCRDGAMSSPNSLAVGFNLAPLLSSVFLTMGSWTGSMCKCHKLTFRLWERGITKQSLQVFAYKGLLHCTQHFELQSHWFLHERNKAYFSLLVLFHSFFIQTPKILSFWSSVRVRKYKESSGCFKAL